MNRKLCRGKPARQREASDRLLRCLLENRGKSRGQIGPQSGAEDVSTTVLVSGLPSLEQWKIRVCEIRDKEKKRGMGARRDCDLALSRQSRGLVQTINDPGPAQSNGEGR